MSEIHVVQRGDGWVGDSSGQVIAASADKEEVIRLVADVARGETASVVVKIHNDYGRIDEERTYPRDEST